LVIYSYGLSPLEHHKIEEKKKNTDYECQGGLKNSCIFEKGKRRKGKKA
jgi:hypothetical protein